MVSLRFGLISFLCINVLQYLAVPIFAQDQSTRADTTFNRRSLEPPSVDVPKDPEKSQNWSVQIEMINAQIQLSSDDAQSVLLYAAITAGIITFFLPILLDPKAEMSYWYWRSVVGGAILLSISACIFFWFSRRITMNNWEHGRILIDMATNPNFDISALRDRILKIPLYKKTYIPILINVNKVFWVLGIVFYLICPITLIVKPKLKDAKPSSTI